MSTPHTPGPWVCAQDKERPCTLEIATVAWVADWVVGVPTPGYPGGNYRDTEYGSNEADATLIAAAPDLLRALDEVVQALTFEDQLHPDYGWGKWLQETILPAIKKARP